MNSTIYGHKFDGFIEARQKALDNTDIIIESFNNDITLLDSLISESFISNIFNKIIELFKKIGQIFSNLLLEINRFKTVTLPKQEIDDLEKCLQVMQPRTLTGTKEVVRYYQKLIDSDKSVDTEIKDGKLNRNTGPKTYSMNTTVEFEIDKSRIDIEESIKALENLSEFKRINENNYSNENTVEIPLSLLISDMKECQQNCFEFEKFLSNLSNRYTKDESVNEKVIEFCRLNIKYYQQRISLLNIFFNNAKFNLSWNKVFADKLITTRLSTNKEVEYKTIKFNRSIIVQLIDILNELQQLSNDGMFNEYMKKHKECCNLIKIPTNSTFLCSLDRDQSNNIKYNNEFVIKIFYFKKDYNKIYVSDKPLYHHSYKSSNISELYPTCLGKFNTLYYPEPRIYVHMNIILNKASKQLDKKNDYFSREEIFNDKLNRFDHKDIKKDMYSIQSVYQVIDKIDYVYKDPEMGGTGVYIETDKPVRVKKINYEEWKKEKGMK